MLWQNFLAAYSTFVPIDTDRIIPVEQMLPALRNPAFNTQERARMLHAVIRHTRSLAAILWTLPPILKLSLP